MADTLATPSQMETLLATGDNYDKWLLWLKSVRPRYVGTPMLAKIDATIAKGEQTRTTIGSVLSSVKDAWAWLKTQGGGALDTLRNAVGLNGLGILPAAIPAAWLYGLGATAVAGTIAAMGYWIGEASNLKKSLEIYDASVAQAIAAGADPIAAINAASAAVTGIVNSESGRITAGSGGFGSQIATQIGTIGKWALFAFVAYKGAQRMGWIR